MPNEDEQGPPDPWREVVTDMTGYKVPERTEVFTSLEGNDGIPLMLVEITKVPEDEFPGNIGWRADNTDYVFPFHRRNGDSLDYYKARISFLGTLTVKDSTGKEEVVVPDGVTPGGSFRSHLGKHLGSAGEWDNIKLYQYIYGSGIALTDLVTKPEGTRGTSWGGETVLPHDQVKLSTFDRAGEAFDRVAHSFHQHSEQLKRWEESLGKEDAAWLGQAAGVFRDLIHHLNRSYEKFATDLRVTSGRSVQAENLHLAKDELRDNAFDMWSAWLTWHVTDGHPLNWLRKLIDNIFMRSLSTNLGAVGYRAVQQQDLYPNAPESSSSIEPYAYSFFSEDAVDAEGNNYGPLHELSTWKAIGKRAIQQWEESIDRALVPPAQRANASIFNTWNNIGTFPEIRTKSYNAENELNKDKAEKDEEENRRRLEEQERREREALERYERDKEEAARRQREAEEEAARREKEALERYERDKREAAEKEAAAKAEAERREKEAKEEAARREAEQQKRYEEQRQEQQQQAYLARLDADRREKEAKAEREQAKAEAEQKEAEAKAEREQEKAEAEQKEAEAKAEAERKEAEAKAEAARREAEAERKEAEAKAEAERKEAEAKAEAERKEKEAKAEAARREAEQQKLYGEQKAEAERKEAEAKAEQERKEAEAKAEAERKEAEAKAEAERKEAEAKAEAARREAEQQRRYEEQKAEAERKETEAKAEAQRREAEQQRRYEEQKAEAERKETEARQAYDQARQEIGQPLTTPNGPSGSLVSDPFGGGPLTDTGTGTAQVNDDGSITTLYPDGTSTTVGPDGDTVTTVRSDGSTDTVELDDGDLIYNPDGSVSSVNEAGSLVTDHRDGTSTVVDPDDRTLTTVYPDGTTVTDPLTASPHGSSQGFSQGSSTGRTAWNSPSPYEEELYDPYSDPLAPPASLHSASDPTGGQHTGGSPMMPGMMPPRVGVVGGESGSNGERSRNVINGDIVTGRPRHLSSGVYDEEVGAPQRGTTTGSPMPPMMPPMGGAPPQQGGDRGDRERSAWVSEEEDVWGTDEGGAPAVIGR